MAPGEQSEAHPEPVIIAQYATEIEATFAANALREAGIRCELVGGASSGFKAEAPGHVRILVSQHDADAARLLLEDFSQERAPEEDGKDPTN
ncbi:MAG: DUF2007 domain-containing protein [Phycisphaeraceae bacterium]|nr:DUF2007 domain-containing protein [Phycisphaeraceae bacterium]